jgi:hypothetical protein
MEGRGRQQRTHEGPEDVSNGWRVVVHPINALVAPGRDGPVALGSW